MSPLGSRNESLSAPPTSYACSASTSELAFDFEKPEIPSAAPDPSVVIPPFILLWPPACVATAPEESDGLANNPVQSLGAALTRADASAGWASSPEGSLAFTSFAGVAAESALSSGAAPDACGSSPGAFSTVEPPDLASLGLALGKIGSTGRAGTAARDAAFAGFVGVAADVVVCEGWTEMGVVGEVDAADSEGGSCVDGVSGRGAGASTIDDFATATAVCLGAEAVLAGGSATVRASVCSAMAPCSLIGSSTSGAPVSGTLRRLLDLAARAGNGKSGLDSQGSWIDKVLLATCV